MHLSIRMNRHWLTTLFGFLLALSQATLHAPGFRDNKTANDLGGIVATVSALALGSVAADANKSNGNKKDN